MKTVLVCVVTGAIYEKFAEDLFSSAEEFFRPSEGVEFLMLEGRSGWPEATMYRHHALRDHFPDADYVYMSDADMLFEAEVGSEILPSQGITATIHPGYVTTVPGRLPYERNPLSASYVSIEEGQRYYCGGFVGGTHQAMRSFSQGIAMLIDADASRGITPVWHDESALNYLLADSPPEIELDPGYCYPDDSSWYETFWPKKYERKLVALDKTQEQRGER